MIEFFEHDMYELAVGGITASAVMFLTAFALLAHYTRRGYSFILGLETIYLAAFVTEMSVMVGMLETTLG